MPALFPQRLRAARVSRAIMQKDAAQALNVSPALLSHYEQGVRLPNLDFICNASQYYGVSTDYLLGLSEVNAHLTSPVQDGPSDTPKVCQKNYTQILEALTIVYDVLSKIESVEISQAVTDYFCANIYRIFRPLCDVHNLSYDAFFSINSDSFALCGASAMLSEATFLMLLNALPPEKKQVLSQLTLEDAFPLNAASGLKVLQEIDQHILQCKADHRYISTYEP